MIFDKMLDKPSIWLDATGPYPEIVLSSRVRYARNLIQYPFVQRAKVSDLKAILDVVRKAASDSELLKGSTFIEMRSISQLDKKFLLERHLVSYEMVGDNKDRGLIISEDEKSIIMINEEDHIRLQTFASGLDLFTVYTFLDKIDDELGRNLDYAFSNEWGYLTACPTNVGTGLRASVLLHLPGLVLTKEIEKVLRGVTQIGLSVRGLYGEGTEVKGNFFQVSNQTTMGKKEEDIIKGLDKVVRGLIEYERNARNTLLNDASPQVEDKIFRAYGLLKNARILSSDEVINLTSAVRLGVGLGMIKNISMKTLNEVLIISQPAHLQKIFGKKMDTEERDVIRANYIRERII